MVCSFCGGEVEWIGSLEINPSTRCKGCGERNCQVTESVSMEGEPTGDPHPCDMSTPELDRYLAGSSADGDGVRPCRGCETERECGERGCAMEVVNGAARRDGARGYHAADPLQHKEIAESERIAGVSTGDGAERRIEAVIEKLRRCNLGCGAFGQCKAAMTGEPNKCAASMPIGSAGNAGVRDTSPTGQENTHG